MNDLFSNHDLEDFASYLGLKGVDNDMFYEAYYNLEEEDDDFEELVEMAYYK